MASSAAILGDALRALGRLREAIWRIRFLTSTDRKLDIYPRALEEVTEDWVGDAVTVQEIHHHPRNDDYPL